MTNNRIIKLDIARTFAIICVVLCHYSQMVYTQQSVLIKDLGFMSRVFFMATFTIGRLGVPIFLYLSGVLLLEKSIEKDEDIFRFYKNNLLPLLIVNEVWIVIYNVYNIFVLKGTFLVTNFIKELLLLKNSDMLNMWYMPMIIGVYIGVPFLAKIVKSFSFKSFKPIMIVMFIFFFIVPALNVFSSIFGINQTFGSGMNVAYMGGTYGLYLIVGYYIYNRKCDRLKNWMLVVLSLISFFIILYVEVYSLYNAYGSIYYVWYDFPFLLICTGCLFVLFTRIKDEYVNKNISRLFTYISRISLGIYFVHSLIILAEIKYIGQMTGKLSLDVFLLMAITIITSVFIVWIFSKNRCLRKYMFMIK